MRRFVLSLSLAVVALLGSVTSEIGTQAQDTTPAGETGTHAETAVHPIVGGWRWVDAADPAFVTYAIFHADGTYVEVVPDLGTNVGVWRATGERTADLTFFFADINPDPDVVERGEGRLAAEVNDAGNAITAPYTFVATAADGTVTSTGEFLTLGTRLEVVPMVPLGTPMAGTPTP